MGVEQASAPWWPIEAARCPWPLHLFGTARRPGHLSQRTTADGLAASLRCACNRRRPWCCRCNGKATTTDGLGSAGCREHLGVFGVLLMFLSASPPAFLSPLRVQWPWDRLQRWGGDVSSDELADSRTQDALVAAADDGGLEPVCPGASCSRKNTARLTGLTAAPATMLFMKPRRVSPSAVWCWVPLFPSRVALLVKVDRHGRASPGSNRRGRFRIPRYVSNCTHVIAEFARLGAEPDTWVGKFPAARPTVTGVGKSCSLLSGASHGRSRPPPPPPNCASSASRPTT